MNNKRNENVDELAARIAELAVELKNEIKNLTSGESQDRICSVVTNRRTA